MSESKMDEVFVTNKEEQPTGEAPAGQIVSGSVRTSPPGSGQVRRTKPTLETRFYIDFDWWEKSGRDLRVYLHHHLCSSCRALYTSHYGAEVVDWIDPETAEVEPVDGLWHTLRTHCSREADYITEATPLVDAVLRVLLANGNVPLTPTQLSSKINQPADKILRVLGRGPVYDGIRPV